MRRAQLTGLIVVTLLASPAARAARPWDLFFSICEGEAPEDPSTREIILSANKDIVSACTTCGSETTGTGAPPDYDWEITFNGRSTTRVVFSFIGASPWGGSTALGSAFCKRQNDGHLLGTPGFHSCTESDGVFFLSLEHDTVDASQRDLETTTILGVPPWFIFTPEFRINSRSGSGSFTVNLLRPLPPPQAGAQTPKSEREELKIRGRYSLASTQSCAGGRRRPGGDSIVLTNPGAHSVVMIAGWDVDEGCQTKYDIYSGSNLGDFRVNNFGPAKSDCRSEIVVFSAGRAPAVLSISGLATDRSDAFPITLQPRKPLAVTIWLDTGGNPTLDRVRDSVAYATYLFDAHYVGLYIDPEFKEMTTSQRSAFDSAPKAGSCPSPDGSGFPFEADRLNIYSLADSGSNRNCAAEPRMIFLRPDANIESLAHEVGHALGLRPEEAGGHTDDCKNRGRVQDNYFPCIDFGKNNLMNRERSGFIRDHISLGQAFRMNFHSDSVLQRQPDTNARACYPNNVGSGCVELWADAAKLGTNTTVDVSSTAKAADEATRSPEQFVAMLGYAGLAEVSHGRLIMKALYQSIHEDTIASAQLGSNSDIQFAAFHADPIAKQDLVFALGKLTEAVKGTDLSLTALTLQQVNDLVEQDGGIVIRDASFRSDPEVRAALNALRTALLAAARN